MASYRDFVGGTRTTNTGGIIRDWANRDENVIGPSVVTRCLDWAADECYRTLRIPTLELTRTFVLAASDIQETGETSLRRDLATIPVPADFIELIYIVKTRSGLQPADGPEVNIVFNHRTDNRTIMDSIADKYDNSYTRIGNEFHLYGNLDVGDTIEIHYYRRLPMLDATYNINATNFNAQTNLREFLTPSSPQNAASGTALYFNTATDLNTAIGLGTGARGTLTASDTVTTHIGYFTGNEAAHWLRDENERILTFGALMEVFNYLDEPESYQRYQQRFHQEIADLNSQERRRDAMGGNVQLQYSGGGLL